jgi:hypothetical protein
MCVKKKLLRVLKKTKGFKHMQCDLINLHLFN